MRYMAAHSMSHPAFPFPCYTFPPLDTCVQSLPCEVTPLPPIILYLPNISPNVYLPTPSLDSTLNYLIPQHLLLLPSSNHPLFISNPLNTFSCFKAYTISSVTTVAGTTFHGIAITLLRPEVSSSPVSKLIFAPATSTPFGVVICLFTSTICLLHFFHCHHVGQISSSQAGDHPAGHTVQGEAC